MCAKSKAEPWKDEEKISLRHGMNYAKMQKKIAKCKADFVPSSTFKLSMGST